VAPVKHKLAALDFHYLAAPLRIANDGHTARVRFANRSRLLVAKETYTLQQFHVPPPMPASCCPPAVPITVMKAHSPPPRAPRV